MNELYVSCVSSTGSDKVFVTKHVDGPYYLFPGCNLLRVLFCKSLHYLYEKVLS